MSLKTLARKVTIILLMSEVIILVRSFFCNALHHMVAKRILVFSVICDIAS